ncbi:hypothetical protein D3C73_1551390 [compost metagenome]
MLGVARMSFLLLVDNAVIKTFQSPLKKPAVMPLKVCRVLLSGLSLLITPSFLY